MKNLRAILEDEVLLGVRKPARYIGGEINMVRKPPESVDVRMALAFPDIYDIGMSHFGLKVLYEVVNRLPWASADRTFAPWTDMEALMREKGIPLYTLENFLPVRECDILGFTVQYELSYTNILNMLDLAGIPLRSEERLGSEYPLVIAGGPAAFVAEPLHEFIDLFVLGDGEEIIVEVLEEFRKWKRESPFGGSAERKRDFMRHLAHSYDGIYVPGFYEVEYGDNGKIKSITPNGPGVPDVVEKNVIRNLDYDEYPVKPLVPLIEIVHDRYMLEVMRGCTQGCRFCQAGILYRPRRERSVEFLVDRAKRGIMSTGWEEISLSSLSTGDFCRLDDLVDRLIEQFGTRQVSLSLSSLRADSFSVSIADKVQSIKKTGLTFAVETASPRLRRVLNKHIDDDELLQAVEETYSRGWDLIKLYFMIGLPTETMDDIDAMIDLIYRISDQRRKKDGRNGNINVSIACFIPKAHTPFQWEGFHSIDELEEKVAYIKSRIKRKFIKLSFHDPRRSFLEAAFSRGDRRLSKVVLAAWKLGCKFDYWTEEFNLDTWRQAFAQCGLDPEEFTSRKLDYDEKLPWEHLSPGVDKAFLAEEHRRAYREEWTPDCYNAKCLNCGNVCRPQKQERGGRVQ